MTSAPSLERHPHAWRGNGRQSPEWIHGIPEPVSEEVVAFARAHAARDLEAAEDLAQLNADLTGLGRAHAVMVKARRRLDTGLGFLVLDRLPMDALSTAEARIAAWALFSCTGRVVDQKHGGTKVYDVIDKKVSLEHGVRRSITNLAQEFHTDAGWLALPPESIGLVCRQPASHGGVNQIASLVSVYNALVEEDPDALARLFEPFWWDRQAEHPPDESRASPQPVFYRARGRLQARYYDDYIRNGQRLAEEPLDAEGERALAVMRAVIERPELRVEFGLERGQFLILDNRRLAHSRTAFQDPDAVGEQPRAPRHYFRIWSRREGSTRLEG